MRLSQIIAACNALGEGDPETNAEKVERAGCVADGIIFTEIAEPGAISELQWDVERARDRAQRAENELEEANREIKELKAKLKAGAR